MPKSTPASDSPSSPETDSETTFEDAYGDLEELVREMESDEMPLADLIEAYERGIKLHALCQKRLEEAQGRIEIIRKKASGEIVTEPFDESAAAPSPDLGDAPAPSLRKNAELF